MGTLLSASVFGGELAGRKMVWAHVVDWFTPDNVSQMPERFYNEPQHDRGAHPYHGETRRALDMGIDGFFVDVCVVDKGASAFWDLRRRLEAAEGTPFQVGICLDHRTTVTHQAEEIIRMLSVYGNHPNYPKLNGRYVVDTYTFFSWTPGEWKEMLRLCREAGYPLHLIANVETGFDPFTEAKLEKYVDVFDEAYYFSILARAHSGTERLPDVIRRTDVFCKAHGKRFMPCLWPGYFGAWLDGRNCFYQPKCGFGTMQARYEAALETKADWLHLTTWNDHDETTLEPRRLTTGYLREIRARAREFKGLSPSAENDVHFAYLREVLPGTVHRFAAMRMPCAKYDACTVAGCLRDAEGRKLYDLQPKTLGNRGWAEVEWLVGTTTLAANPVLVPEFTVTDAKGAKTVTLPPVFVFAPSSRNPETVKVSLHDRRALKNDLSVTYADGVLKASCSFDASVPVHRATLYCNERPVTGFRVTRDASVTGATRTTVLPLCFHGHHTVTLVPENGEILCGIKSFETNGMQHYSWSAKGMRSGLTPTWMRFSALVAASENTRLAFSSAGETRTFTARELVRDGRYVLKDGSIELSPDCTLRDMSPLDCAKDTLELAVWSRAPEPTDAYWVQYEFADGTHAESRVVHPFAKERVPVPLNVVETPVTIDWTSGASGQPGTCPFTSPCDQWPVREMRVVETKVSPLSIRRHRVPMAGSPRPRAKLMVREWPMGAFRLTCGLVPHAADGKDHGVLLVGGWQEGPRLRLLSDGRLEGAYLCEAGRDKFCVAVTSREPLVRGKTYRIELGSDCRELVLTIDGVKQNSASLSPRRVYGNCQPSLGEGVNGANPAVAELFDLVF